MKRSLILILFMWLVGWQLNAQNCDVIRQKIKIAIDKSLDEALVEVKALRACDNSAAGKKEADDWTERIFKILKERQTQAKAAEIRAKAEAEQAQRDAEVAETARKQAEIERNNALAAQSLAAEKSKEKDLAEEEKSLALSKKVQLIRVADLQLLGRNKVIDQQYYTAIGYFNQALLALQKMSPRNETFLQDSLDLLQDIAVTEKKLGMQVVIKRLYNNVDSVMTHQTSSFPSVFKYLNEIFAKPISQPSPASFSKDSLSFIKELEQFDLFCMLKIKMLKMAPRLQSALGFALFWNARKYKKTEEQFLQLMMASAEINYFLNERKKVEKRLGKAETFSFEPQKYTDAPILKAHVTRFRRFGIGVGVQKYLWPGGEEPLVFNSKGETLASIIGARPSAQIQISAEYRLNEKTSFELGISPGLAINNWLNRAYFTFNGDYNYLNNNAVNKDFFMSVNTEIFNINRHKKSSLISIQLLLGATVGVSDMDISNYDRISFSFYDYSFSSNSDIFFLDPSKYTPQQQKDYREWVVGKEGFSSTNITISPDNKSEIIFDPRIDYVGITLDQKYFNIFGGIKTNYYLFPNTRLFLFSKVVFNHHVSAKRLFDPIGELKKRNLIPEPYKDVYLQQLESVRKADLLIRVDQVQKVAVSGIGLSLGLALRL